MKSFLFCIVVFSSSILAMDLSQKNLREQQMEYLVLLKQELHEWQTMDDETFDIQVREKMSNQTIQPYSENETTPRMIYIFHRQETIKMIEEQLNN